MKADKSKMFSIPLKSLRFEDGAPFPIYIFLKKNERFVPIRMPGDAIGMQKYEKFLSRDYCDIWVPNTFKDVYQTYIDYNKSAAPTESPEPTPAAVVAEAAPVQANTSTEPAPVTPPKISEEAELVRDVIEDEELNTEDKAKILSAVSQDLLRSLNQITTRGESARSEGIRRCKDIADEIINIASLNSNIYDEILALRNSQEDLEHSVMVGTLTVMFALAIGFTDEILLADMTLAAVFHDIGLVRLNPGLLTKKESAWNAAERSEYESHVKLSIDILKEGGTNFHPRIFRMIKEHHENYDGSGFPEHLKGASIDETSQLLHLGNLFDRLCNGKQTGTELSPAEAFDYINAASRNPSGKQELQPELVQRVLQFMLAEKDAADILHKEAEDRTKGAMASL